MKLVEHLVICSARLSAAPRDLPVISNTRTPSLPMHYCMYPHSEPLPTNSYHCFTDGKIALSFVDCGSESCGRKMNPVGFQQETENRCP